MNCEDFEKIVTELADYQPMLSTTRDAGVSHAAWCADCARKLADVRAVSASLLLAAGAESETAPTVIKANLMSAFQEQVARQLAASNVVEIAHFEERRRRKLRWPVAAGVAAIAAAVILLAVILPLWKTAPAPTMSPVIAKSGSDSPAPATLADPPFTRATVAPHEAASRRDKRHIMRTRVAAPTTTDAVARKGVDEYLPLAYLAKTTAMDTGIIVRVRLSRSALVSLGLPVNLENSSDSVSAEVVMGDDGVARAIRLVQ
jgi:hypothetical protein